MPTFVHLALSLRLYFPSLLARLAGGMRRKKLSAATHSRGQGNFHFAAVSEKTPPPSNLFDRIEFRGSGQVQLPTASHQSTSGVVFCDSK